MDVQECVSVKTEKERRYDVLETAVLTAEERQGLTFSSSTDICRGEFESIRTADYVCFHKIIKKKYIYSFEIRVSLMRCEQD